MSSTISGLSSADENEINEKRNERQVIYQDVDPYQAGWDTRIAFKGKFMHRVFFENDIGLRNGLQMDTLRGWLEDKCGVEDEDWVLCQSDEPMEYIWNRNKIDYTGEAHLYGNNVYLTDISWLVNEKLIQDQNDPTQPVDDKHTVGRITVVQTRK